MLSDPTSLSHVSTRVHQLLNQNIDHLIAIKPDKLQTFLSLLELTVESFGDPIRFYPTHGLFIQVAPK